MYDGYSIIYIYVKYVYYILNAILFYAFYVCISVELKMGIGFSIVCRWKVQHAVFYTSALFSFNFIQKSVEVVAAVAVYAVPFSELYMYMYIHS